MVVDMNKTENRARPEVGKLIEKDGDLLFCQDTVAGVRYYSKEKYEYKGLPLTGEALFEISNFRAKKGIKLLLENSFIQYESSSDFIYPQNALEFFPPDHLLKASEGFGEIVFNGGQFDYWTLRQRPTGIILGHAKWNDLSGIKNLINRALDRENTLSVQVALLAPEDSASWASYRADLKELAKNTTFDKKLENYLNSKSIKANALPHSPTIVESLPLTVLEYVEEEIRIGYSVFIYSPVDDNLGMPENIFSVKGSNSPALEQTYEELIKIVEEAGYTFMHLEKYGRLVRGVSMEGGSYAGWNMIVNNPEVYEKYITLFQSMLEYSSLPYYPTETSTYFHFSVSTDPFKALRGQRYMKKH